MDAKDAVGEQQQDDWVLKPAEHAGTLPEHAMSLKTILKSDAIQPIMASYEEADARAANHQKAYKKWGRNEVCLTACAAIAGSILLYISNEAAAGAAVHGGQFKEIGRIILLVLQATALAGIAAATFFQRNGNYFKKWMEARTKAEKKRIELFETVCGMKKDIPLPLDEGGNEIARLPLQLEYFRRYQLEVQINYYKGRGKLHEHAARQWLSRGAAIVFIGALAGAVTSALTVYGDWINVFAIMGVITPILLGAQSKLSLLSQDERNAIRYEITLEHLRGQQQQLSEIRQAAENNNADQVHRFVKQVNAIISVEHSQWIEETRTIDAQDVAETPH